MKKRDNNLDKLNIAMIGHKRIPSREGGVEIVVDELVTRMALLGHKVSAYNRKGHHVSGKEFDGDSNRRQYEKEHKGVRIITIPTIESKGVSAVLSSFFATIHALFGDYDCIHYHAEGPAAMLVIPHLFGIRTIVTIHGLDWQRAKWGSFATQYLKYGEKIAAKYADEVIVLSKNVQQYFRDTYNRETVFIPNGIDRPKVLESQLIKEKWSLEKDSYILFLGRIVPEKGIQYLIDAYSQVDTLKRLVIAGGASDTDKFMVELKRKAKQDGRVVFTGFVQEQTLEELYSNAYLYVLPSDLEGMPISLLEAMSYGNCCLVSSIDECTEVVEDKAVIFEKANVNSLTMELQSLCDNPKMVKKYKGDSAEFITQKYSWSDIVKRTINLYGGKKE